MSGTPRVHIYYATTPCDRMGTAASTTAFCLYAPAFVNIVVFFPAFPPLVAALHAACVAGVITFADGVFFEGGGWSPTEVALVTNSAVPISLAAVHMVSHASLADCTRTCAALALVVLVARREAACVEDSAAGDEAEPDHKVVLTTPTIP